MLKKSLLFDLMRPQTQFNGLNYESVIVYISSTYYLHIRKILIYVCSSVIIFDLMCPQAQFSGVVGVLVYILVYTPFTLYWI